jgi:putative mRNA 3-end processing factor
MLTFTKSGLYCQAGGFYIDPWVPVDKAVITHAHSDHARWGSRHYLCHSHTAPLLQLRLGDISVETLPWGEPKHINGVKVSLHPAGHIIGSSQVRIEYNGEVWVVSGDYKTTNDGISGAFEPVKCHHFVTESTFGLPIYRWEPQETIYNQMREWVIHNKANGYSSVIMAYSLGKAQRVISALAPLGMPIYAHGAIANAQEKLIASGFDLPRVVRVQPAGGTRDTAQTTSGTNSGEDSPTTRTTSAAPKRSELKESLVIGPPSIQDSSWLKQFGPARIASCSGWMQVRGNVRRRNLDAGFVLSDHADWDGLLSALKATGARRVFVTHGFQAAFSRYLNEIGIESHEVSTNYGAEESEE